MTQIALPKTNQTGTNEWADVEDNDNAIVAVVNGNIDNGNIASGAVIAYSKLAAANTGQALIGNAGTPTMTTLSGDATVGATGTVTVPVVGTYRPLLSGAGVFANDSAADTYTLDFQTYNGWVTTTGGLNSLTTGTPRSGDVPMIYLDDADYTLTGRTTKLRIRAQVHANATAPGTMTFTFGLYPITVAGIADNLLYTVGSVVAGSTAVATNPASSTITSCVGSDFNVPSDGMYVFGCVTNATIANNSAVAATVQLQQRWT